MKHLGLETNRGFKWLNATFLILVSLLANAQLPKEDDLFSLDPEVVTGRSFGTVTALASSPTDESLWIGTESEGILRIGRNGNRICYNQQSGHLESNGISELCFVSPRMLYILYSNGRVSRYSSTEGFSHLNNLSFAVDHILPAQGEGNLICSSKDGKISILGPNNTIAALFDVKEPVSVITNAEDGSLFLVGAASRSVQRLKDGRIETLTSPLSETPTSLLVMSDGRIWAGTGQGLYSWSTNGWKRYSTADGLLSNRINTILYDGSGKIYLTTYNGIQRIDVSNPDVSNCDIYFKGDSFTSDLKSANNGPQLYFGGTKGIAILTSDSHSVSIPWSLTPEESDIVEHKPVFNIWYILPLILIGLIGFFTGRHFKFEKKEPEPVILSQSHAIKPVSHDDPPKVARATEPVVDDSAPSHDDVFNAIRKLLKGSAPEFSLKVWKMIEESYTDSEFSVADIASRLLLSRVHVNRKLQQEIGVSPSSLLKAKRMTAARELMIKGGLTLKDIADQTGFSSATFLSTSFKEYYGHSPSEVTRSS